MEDRKDSNTETDKKIKTDTKHATSSWWAGGALAVVAFIVVVAGVASACTVFKGKLTVTGNGATPGSVTASGRGNSMSWCRQPSGTANVTSNTAGTVGVAVAPETAGAPCFAAQLPATDYDIRWTVGTWDPSDINSPNCMSTTDIGDVTVGAGGTGSATSGSFNPGAAGTISVCVADKAASPVNGNQVPVSVI